MSASVSDGGVPSKRAGWDGSVAVPLLVVHVLGLGLAPFTLTRAGLVALVVTYLVTGFGVTAGAHRLFAHRTFTPSPLLRDVLGLAFLLSAQGSIQRWVRDHVLHHRYSDRDGDPHSPRLYGFLWAHVEWLWKKPPREEARQLYERATRDLDAGRAGRFFHHGGRLAALHVAVVYLMYAIGAFIEQGVSVAALIHGWRTGLSLVVWGVLLRIVLVMHSTFFVNSAAHLWGRRPYETSDGSRNLWWVAVIALGEGWHNNHHARPSAANNGFHTAAQVDLTFLLLLFLGAIGQLHDLKVWRPGYARTQVWFRMPDTFESSLTGELHE